MTRTEADLRRKWEAHWRRAGLHLQQLADGLGTGELVQAHAANALQRHSQRHLQAKASMYQTLSPCRGKPKGLW